MTSFSLRSIRLRPGEEHREEQQVALEPVWLGGQRYLPVPEKVRAELAIAKASSGTVFELRFGARLHGPCYRCLADAVVDVQIAGRRTSPTTSSISPAGHGTRSSWSCRTRSSAGPIAPGSVPFAAGT